MSPLSVGNATTGSSDANSADVDAVVFLKAVCTRDVRTVSDGLAKVRLSDGEEGVHALLSFTDEAGNTLLHRCARGVAAKRGSHGRTIQPEMNEGVAVTELLLEVRANVNATNQAGETPLLSAMRSTAWTPLGLVKTLLVARADVRRGEAKHGVTPLMEAMRRGDSALCLQLIDRKADLMQQNAHGLDPISVALQSGRDLASVASLVGDARLQEWCQRKQHKYGMPVKVVGCPLKAIVSDVRAALGQPLEYVVVHSPHVDIHEGPSVWTAVVGQLKHGTLVTGYPADQWLLMDTTRASAWAPLDGAHMGKGRLLAPQWAAVVSVITCGPEKALELFWPGIPNVKVTYVVQWRLCDSDIATQPVLDTTRNSSAPTSEEPSTSGQVSTGSEPHAMLYTLPRATALQFRVSASISGPEQPLLNMQLHGAWVDVPWDSEDGTCNAPKQEQPSIAEHAERFMPIDRASVPKHTANDSLIPQRDATMGTALSSTCPAGQATQDPDAEPKSCAPDVRVIIAQSKPAVIIVEVNKHAIFNTMDAILGNDLLYAIETTSKHFQSGTDIGAALGAYVIQGSGPHFCPGGNPSLNIAAALQMFKVSTFATYVPFVRIREAGVPIVCVQHGTQVGGGVAFAVSASFCIGAINSSMSFGNVPRVPSSDMALSKSLTFQLALPTAMNIYLTNGTISIFGCIEAGLVNQTSPTSKSAKKDALTLACRMTTSSVASALGRMCMPVDLDRLNRVCRRMHMCAASGMLLPRLNAQREAASESDCAKPRSTPVAASPTDESGSKSLEKRDWSTHLLLLLGEHLPRWMPPICENVIPGKVSSSGRRIMKRIEETGKVIGDVSIDKVEAVDRRYMQAIAESQKGSFSKEAEDAIRNCLSCYEQLVGAGHHRTMYSMHCLGVFLLLCHEHTEAEPLLSRAMQLHTRALGPLHPRTLSVMNNFALCYLAQDQYEMAAPLFREALAGMERSRGLSHPSTNTIATCLARCLYCQRQFLDAAPFARQALEGQLAARGPTHYSSLIFHTNLAMCLHYHGKLDEAATHLNLAMEGFRATLGIQHWATQFSIKMYTALLDELGKPTEATEMRKEIVGLSTLKSG